MFNLKSVIALLTLVYGVVGISKFVDIFNKIEYKVVNKDNKKLEKELKELKEELKKMKKANA